MQSFVTFKARDGGEFAVRPSSIVEARAVEGGTELALEGGRVVAVAESVATVLAAVDAALHPPKPKPPDPEVRFGGVSSGSPFRLSEIDRIEALVGRPCAYAAEVITKRGMRYPVTETPAQAQAIVDNACKAAGIAAKRVTPTARRPTFVEIVQALGGVVSRPGVARSEAIASRVAAVKALRAAGFNAREDGWCVVARRAR